MKLTILGATGALGLHVTQQAVVQGHDVHVFNRSPSKLGDLKDRVTVHQGDITDVSTLQAAVRGADAVVSCIGWAKGTEPGAYGDALRAVVSESPPRLIAISGAGLELPGDAGGFGRRIIITVLKVFMPKLLEGKRKEYLAVRDADIDWTLVRVARMAEATATGAVAVDLHQVSGKTTVAYADVAQWMIARAQDTEYARQAPFVSGAS